MKFIAIILIFLTVNNVICAMHVGIIRNVSLRFMFPFNVSMNESTCNECLCVMLTTTGNSSIVSFNCHTKDINSVVCQLFTIANYRYSSFYEIETNFNSTFYFLQLPSNDPSIMTTVDTVTTFQGIVLYLIVISGKS